MRLPGELRPLATRFRMVDPGDTGLRRVANIIKGLTTAGNADKACLDADTADGLSAQERIAQGMSMRDINRAAAAHGWVQFNQLKTMEQAPMAAPTLR